MIKLTDNFELYDFSSFKDDVFFQRIYSDFKTLSSFEDVMFYVSLNDDEITAVISKVSGNITLSAKETAPIEEINEFFNVVGFSKILCEEKFARYFDGQKTEGNILKFSENEHYGYKAKLLYTENLKDMYVLLKEVFGIDADFSYWFTDMSYKLRHGGASFCGVYEENRLISAAFSLFETEKSAIVSSVATDNSYRCRGYGERVVKTLLDKNFGKDVYVFTENEKTENWYKKMGFVPCKKWSEIENVL